MKPLENKRILVTRPRVQAADLCDKLAAQGATPIFVNFWRKPRRSVPHFTALHTVASDLNGNDDVHRSSDGFELRQHFGNALPDRFPFIAERLEF